MEKVLQNSLVNRVSHQFKSEQSKKRLAKLNFYLRQIGQGIRADTLSLYK